MSYNNQNALRIEEISDAKGLQDSFRKTKPDPLLDMEYVSPVNQGRFSTIGRLESSVSLLQSAQLGIEKTKQWLQEIRQFLEGNDNQPYPDTIPWSVANRFIEDRLALMEELIKSTRFHGKGVLDGSYGVKGEASGNRLKFVRGSARVSTSPVEGYAVEIFQPPRPSILQGLSRLTPEEVQRERLIALHDGSHEVRYRLRSDETPESLVKNLKTCLMKNYFDVDVFQTEDNRLLFRHNQLGSKNSFKGISYGSRLVSKTPGQYSSSIPGIDLAGKIGSESAHGDGGYLIGDKGNRDTDGLVVFFDGQVDYPGQIVGTVHIVQNGIAVPLDASESEMEMLSLPAIDPTLMAAGVPNGSGFEDLGSIRVLSDVERIDALKMVIWSLIYLKFLAKELKSKENEYVERTIQLLKGSMTSLSLNEDALYLSKEKATDMIGQLHEMLKK